VIRLVINLLRGFRGHPSHPPLTDASIGAYTAGSFLVFLGWFGVVEEKLAWGGFLAIAAGLVLAIPTILTGFADYVRIPRGTAKRRTANFHWVVMSCTTATYLVADAMLQTGFDTGQIPGSAALVTLIAFLLLFAGGYIGGTVVFVYGMRVLGEDRDHPTLEALTPKYPPD
jgi:uncharacterized membrane protein